MEARILEGEPQTKLGALVEEQRKARRNKERGTKKRSNNLRKRKGPPLVHTKARNEEADKGKLPWPSHARIFARAALAFTLTAAKDSMLYGFGKLLGMGKDKVLEKVSSSRVENSKPSQWDDSDYYRSYDESYF